MSHKELVQQTIDLMLVILLLAGCGAPTATHTPDRVATGVAEAKAIAATLTAEAPTAAVIPTTTPIAIATHTPDHVATGVAEAKAIAATLTAEAKAVAATLTVEAPTATAPPTKAPTATATDAPEPTPTPVPPTPTPMPPAPTLTSVPPTPTPTNTPTTTPSKTPTPVLTKTLTPRPTLPPYDTLADQIAFWTKLETQEWPSLFPSSSLDLWFELWDTDFLRHCHIDYYLTYLSPQLIEAAVNYKAEKDALTESQRNQLLERAMNRFVERESTAFVLYIRGNADDLKLIMGPLAEKTQLVNLRGEVSTPHEYTWMFDQQMLLRADKKGYVFFPMSIYPENDWSFDVMISEVMGQGCQSALNPLDNVTDLQWQFDLYGLIPLEEFIVQQPQPEPEFEIPIDVIFGVLSLLIDIVGLLL